MTSRPTPRLEPMTLGGILDRSVRLYVDNYLLLLSIVSIVAVPFLALRAILPILFSRFMAWQTAFSFGTMIALVLLSLFLSPLLMAALIHAVSAFYLEKQVSVRSAFAPAWTMVLSLWYVTFLATMNIGVGFLLLVIPGLIFMTRYALAIPVRVLEGKRGMKALYRSRDLVKNYGWKVFGMIIAKRSVSWIIVLLVSHVASMFIDVATPTGIVLKQLIVQAGSFLVLPVTLSFSILMYYDLRIRKEGFDLEVLSQSLSVAPNDGQMSSSIEGGDH